LITTNLFGTSDDDSKDFSSLKSINNVILNKALNDESEKVAARLPSRHLKVSTAEDYTWFIKQHSFILQYNL
jgi:hypothetical protein